VLGVFTTSRLVNIYQRFGGWYCLHQYSQGLWSLLDPEEKGAVVLNNVGSYLPVDTASRPGFSCFFSNTVTWTSNLASTILFYILSWTTFASVSLYFFLTLVVEFIFVQWIFLSMVEWPTHVGKYVKHIRWHTWRLLRMPPLSASTLPA